MMISANDDDDDDDGGGGDGDGDGGGCYIVGGCCRDEEKERG